MNKRKIFRVFHSKFFSFSEVKIKEDVFIGSEIPEPLGDSEFGSAFHGKKKDEREAFKLIAERYLGKRRIEN